MNPNYQDITALNNSGMDYLSKSPAHYRAYIDGLLDAAPTQAQTFGAAFHCAVLEADQFTLRYTRFDGDRRTKAGKEEYAALAAAGFIVLSGDDWQTIKAMRQSLMQHPMARLMIETTEHEVIGQWMDKESGAACKGIADCWKAEAGVLGELKTCQDASPQAFMLAMARYQYHRQAAFYLDGFGAQAINIIAVEKEPPYAVAMYRVPPHVLAVGRAIYKPLAALYQHCSEAGEWPAYEAGLRDLHLPAWAIPDQLAA